jgi:hypothetical protein
VPHVALAGDSIFANRAYTRGEPDVVAHLRSILPAAWRATLCAVDGATISRLREQLSRVPADASHVIVAIGGNDALANSDLLTLPVRSSSEALDAFATRACAFEDAYATALDAVLELTRQVTVCTIYNGALEPTRASAARVGLAVFNDVIIRVAAARRVDIIDLRAVCVAPADYANPIEPSGTGGLKIARAIARAIGAGTPPPPAPSRLWGAAD